MRAVTSRLPAITSLLVASSLANCWLAVGVEDREVTRGEGGESGCGYPFFQTTTPECNACLNESCCAELRDCTDDEACRHCTTPNPLEWSCTDPNSFVALGSCLEEHCKGDCYKPWLPFPGKPFCGADYPVEVSSCVQIGDYFGGVQCNPITNEGCVAAEFEACSFDFGIGVFRCFATGHALPLCATCGLLEGLCAPGLECVNNVCMKYCCKPEDCGQFATCLFPFPDLEIGGCVEVE